MLYICILTKHWKFRAHRAHINLNLNVTCVTNRRTLPLPGAILNLNPCENYDLTLESLEMTL